MLQNILVYLIIAIVFFLVARNAYRMFKKDESGSSACGGCTGCDLGRSSESIKKESREKNKEILSNRENKQK